MADLVRIDDKLIGDETIPAVSARELHQKLGVKKPFTDWIKSRINRFGMEENIDFFTYKNTRHIGNGGGRPRTEYYISRDFENRIFSYEQHTNIRNFEYGYVYAIGVEGFDIFKIGAAIDVDARKNDLQGANPFTLYVFRKEIFKSHLGAERFIHKRLKPYRIRNEWFKVKGDEILKAIKECHKCVH